MASGGLPSIEKLQGRENYNTWQFAMQTYLEHEELWECVLGTEKDIKKNSKARSKIILMIEPINYVHIQTTTTAKDVWDKLKMIFEDSGLTRKVGLLRTLITTRLENSETVEEYVNKIVSTAHKLTGVGFEVSDEWIGTLLLAGLSEEYKPMIMGIESSGVKITGDSIKTKLLQDVKVPKTKNENAFYVNNFRDKNKGCNRKPKGPRCFNCNKYGHKSMECTKSTTKKAGEKSHNSLAVFCASLLAKECNRNDWYVDSGASMHMTMRDDWLQDKVDPVVKEIVVANDTRLQSIATGNVNLKINCNGQVNSITIKNVLHVPNLSANLLSVSQIIKNGCKVNFNKNGCSIYNGNNLIATATLIGDMYKLNQYEDCSLMVNVKSDNYLWHRRLAHINFNDLNKLKNGLSTGVKFSCEKDYERCIACLKGKQCRMPFKNVGTRATKILELIHSDLCGPMETTSIGGARYFLTLIDDLSRKVFIYFLETKSQVKEVFQDFKTLVENQTAHKIKILRTDNGTEYCNSSLEVFMQKFGIRHQTSTPHTPEHNGLAERMNRTIVEKAKCMLFDAGLQKEYWAEAVSTAVYLINRSPTNGLKKTPEEIWSGKVPDLSHLKIFDCRAMVHVPKHKRGKWDSKSEELIFVGYCEDTKGYRLIRPNSKKIVKSRDVIFIEDSSPSNLNQYKKFSETVPILLPNENPVGDGLLFNEQYVNDTETTATMQHSSTDVIDIPRRSQRQPKPKDMKDYMLYTANAYNLQDPLTVDEALQRYDSEMWKTAMQEEYDSLMSNDTWTLIDLPPDRKPINCKWVFKTKRDATGGIQRYKARLVIKGCAQKRGIDYEETYSPVVRYTSIRYLIALSAQFDLEIEQMDAVTAFLQGDLNEKIYMVQPKEFQVNQKVCLLNKAIYGLKQASRQWNKKLDLALKEFGLTQSKVDPCIYFMTENEKMLFIAVYVDDLLIFTNNEEAKIRIKNELHDRFKMKDMGKAHYCVGLRITRDIENGRITIDQQQYIEEILHKFNMVNCNPAATPADPNQKLTKDMSPKTDMEFEVMQNVPYQEAVGSILYLSQGTRPDIAYAVNTVSKFNSNPGKGHWNAVKRIFRYLKGTSNMKLQFLKNSDSNLSGFCDADWASDTDERRSCTAYVFTLQGGAVSWNCKRQPTVALSTTEAEYMALSAAAQEAIWLQQFRNELWSNLPMEYTKICCDNQSAIKLALLDAYRARTKHIDVRHHFIRQKIEDGHIKINYISTEEMVADSLTKAVHGTKQMFCAKEMGLVFN